MGDSFSRALIHEEHLWPDSELHGSLSYVQCCTTYSETLLFFLQSDEYQVSLQHSTGTFHPFHFRDFTSLRI